MSINGQTTINIGSSAASLDIFIKDDADVAVDPSGIIFRIFDPLDAVVVTETSGNKVDVGRYNASGVTIPTTSPIGEGWRIDWSIVLAGGTSGTFSESFCTKTPGLSATFSSPTVDVETIYDRVRIDIGDPDGSIFTDGLLQRTLKKAIDRANRRLGLVDVESGNSSSHFFLFFNCSLRRPKIEVDLSTGVLTPNTDPYIDIIILQMEEILLRAEMSNFKRLNVLLGGTLASGVTSATKEGVSITNADGVKIAVAPGRFSARANMFKQDVDLISAEVERAIRDFRWRLSGNAGIDVTLPRYGSYGYGYGHGTGYAGYNGSIL